MPYKEYLNVFDEYDDENYEDNEDSGDTDDEDFDTSEDYHDEPVVITQPSFYEDSYKPATKTSKLGNLLFRNPKSVYHYLDKHVYGHEQYKKALSLFAWKAYHGHRPGVLLIAGPSGNGKTEFMRCLKKIYKHLTITDFSTVTPHGYKGDNKSNSCLKNINTSTNGSPLPIVCLDEIDKYIIKATRSWNDTSLIFELLTMLEGAEMNVGTDDKPNYVDTSKVAFILLGSFSAISDDADSARSIGFNAELTNQNKPSTLSKDKITELLPPEIQGRIEDIVILNAFTEQDYINIISNAQYSPTTKIEHEYKIKLSVTEDRLAKIAHNCYANKTGVRSMTNEINRYVNDMLFENPTIKEIVME